MDTAYGTGRLFLPDERDSRYLMRQAVEPLREVPRYRYYWVPTVLNQGSTPQCVGYSWSLFLRSSPVAQDSPPPQTIYCAAQRLDPWPGDCDNPQYDGATVRSGAKFLQDEGLVTSYLWAFSAQDIADWILSGKGPVVLGTIWYNSMFYPEKDGMVPVHPESGGGGGHAYLIIGYNADDRRFRIVNSWGREWGQSGRAWISYDDMEHLLSQHGEACTALES